MLQTGNYDVLEFSMPIEGMNQNISPDALPPSFAQWLENIVAKPLGEGHVRFGTGHIASLPDPESVILKQFPFVKPDGSCQILLYVQEYTHDATAKDFEVERTRPGGAFSFSFASPDNAARYARDTAIKVGYTLNGRMALYDEVAMLAVSDGAVTATLRQNAFPAEATITAVAFSTGAIYCYDFASRTLSPALKRGLCVACIPRYATFMGKLLICNGVDRVLSWDGATLEEAHEFVEERLSEASGVKLINPGHLQAYQFSFTVPPGFDIENYAVGNSLRIAANGFTAGIEVAARTLGDETLTVTATTGLPDFIQDFMSGSLPLALGASPSSESLDLIQNGLLGIFCEAGKLYGKVSGKDKMEIKIDKGTASCTAQGLAPDIFARLMKFTVNPLQNNIEAIPWETEDVETLRRYTALCGYTTRAGDAPRIFYQAWPPRFSFLFVAHDRLWALGEGAAGLEYRAPVEALRVYYAAKPNTAAGWFHALTRTVPSLDLSAKHGEPDNLEAICLVGNCMAFMGRKKTQTYQGQSPLPLNEGGDFAFHSILPTGVIHGDLLVELANDVFFISASGLQSFSTLNVAKQFAATSLDAVNPLIQQYAASLASSNINYRSCCSYRYEAGTLAGFKIGNNKVLCSLFSTTLYSWTLFSGDFEAASSFLTFGNRLYLSLHNEIYVYADGQDGNPPRYGDRDGKQLIPFSWALPVIADALKGRRFANKRYEIQLDYPSSFTLRRENRISIGISGDLPKSYEIDSPCRFEMRGDLLQGVPLTQDQEPAEDSLGFRFEQPFGFFKDRLKFMASKFWLTLSGYTKDGLLTFKKIKLYGIIERR